MALVGMEYKGICGGGWRKVEFIKIGKLPFNSLPQNSSWLQNCEWRVTIDPMKTVVEAPGFWNEFVGKKKGWRTWEVMEDLVYMSVIPGVGTLVVEKGYVTNFASSPRILWPLIPPDGSYTPASVVHDRLYSLRYDRKIADAIFLEAMKASGTWMSVRYVMWAGVRLCGWTRYLGKKKE